MKIKNNLLRIKYSQSINSSHLLSVLTQQNFPRVYFILDTREFGRCSECIYLPCQGACKFIPWTRPSVPLLPFRPLCSSYFLLSLKMKFFVFFYYRTPLSSLLHRLFEAITFLSYGLKYSVEVFYLFIAKPLDLVSLLSTHAQVNFIDTFSTFTFFILKYIIIIIF